MDKQAQSVAEFMLNPDNFELVQEMFLAAQEKRRLAAYVQNLQKSQQKLAELQNLTPEQLVSKYEQRMKLEQELDQ